MFFLTNSNDIRILSDLIHVRGDDPSLRSCSYFVDKGHLSGADGVNDELFSGGVIYDITAITFTFNIN